MEVAQTREGIPLEKRLFRFAAPVALAGALVGGSLVVAGPAQATAGDCYRYLDSIVGKVSPEQVDACEVGSQGTDWSRTLCIGMLKATGVSDSGSRTACRLAAA
ncbi:hypothetical protein [Streptomyces sp. MP131-18]|uniref:hypothetical protein n=1 Tax=Streptomyces sp. MP131-18 TaxID=1857892 RepID=UPI00117E9942|nr:hypothetical protein [Streptomyces sp. MP131-18]